MALDPSIALQYRGVQAPDPLAQYGTVAQIQGAQQANALRALQTRELEESVARRNRLTAQLGAPEFAALNPEKQVNALVRGGFLTEARSLAESQSKVAKEQREAEKTAVDIAAANMKRQRDLLPAVKANPAAWAIWRADTIKALPGLANIIPTEYSPAAADALMLEADKALEQHFVSQNLGGTERVLAMPKYGTGAAAVVPGSAAAVQPLPPEVEAQRARLNAAGAARQTMVNVQEKAEAGAFGKMLVDQYQDISKAAGLAIKTLPSIEANLGALNKGLDTGFGTEARAAGARILGALGVEGAEKLATDTQTFQSNAINAVLQKQLEQKGPQTESDARRIEQVGAELGKTKAANEFILSMAKEQLRRDIEQRNFYDKWKKKTGSFEGAEDAWFSGEGGKSLFDRPALKKYAPGPSAVQQIPGQRPVPAPTAPPAAAPAAAARTVVRTGTLNGRRVVQYSDGSTAYAD